MSTELSITNRAQSTPSTPTEQSMALTANMLTVVAKSSQPLQQEIIKTAQMMDGFMEKMRQSFETLSEENKLLKEELLKEKTRNQEAQTAHLAQTKAFNETVNTLNGRIASLEKTVVGLQNNVVASQHAHNALQNSHHALLSRFNGHTHDGPGFIYPTYGPS